MAGGSVHFRWGSATRPSDERSGSSSQLCQRPAVCTWLGHLTSLYLIVPQVVKQI